MKQKASNKSSKSYEREAIGRLLEYHAIRQCPDHGHMRDNTDPYAVRKAHDAARAHPFSGTTADESVAAVENALHWIGDTCPECTE